MSHGQKPESSRSAAEPDDAERLISAVAERGEVPIASAGAAAGLPQCQAGPLAWQLVREGRLAREGDLVRVPPRPTVPAHRRDPSHAERRAAEWSDVERLDPGAGRGGIQVTQVAVVRRAVRADAVAPARVTLTIEADLDEDVALVERAVGDRLREMQREEDVQRPLSADDEARLSELAAHVAEHGSGVESLEAWNRTHPESAYSGRQSFRRAARRAIARQRSVAGEWWRFAGRPEIQRLPGGGIRI